MGNLKVSVNPNLCVGSKLCISFLPDVFEMDAHGQSQVVSLDSATELDLLQTAEQCPQCAIRVENTETGEILFPPPELER